MQADPVPERAGASAEIVRAWANVHAATNAYRERSIYRNKLIDSIQALVTLSVAEASASQVRAAVERCCAAVCGYCATGNIPRADGHWFTGYSWPHPCYASKIRSAFPPASAAEQQPKE